MQLIPFSQVSVSQMKELADIHVNSIPYSINARSGIDHIYNLYAHCKESDEIYGFVATEGRRAIGLVLASRSHKTSTSVSKPLRKKLFIKLFGLRFFAQNLTNLIDFVSISNLIARKFSESSYLMLWYVDNEHQGKGLGRELLDTMCNELTQRQFKSVVVDVRKTSSNAINSYLKNDFKLQSSTFLSQVLIKELDCTR